MPEHESFLKHPESRPSLSLDALYLAHARGDFGNPPWEEARGRFLVVRLSPFRDVERSTPHEFLFRELREALPSAYVDFSFFPTARDRPVLEAAGVPWLHGVASARGARDFDAILVSNAYTLELVNLALSLRLSGLPVTRAARAAPFPLVILGGSNAMASAAVVDEASGDSMVDAVFFGEAEGAVRRLAPGLAAAARLTGAERDDILAGLASEVPGFWPTATGETVGRAMPQGDSARARDHSAGARGDPAHDQAGPESIVRVDQAKAPADAYPEALPPLLAGEESGTARLEITRGCPSFCSFCFEGWERKPFRERSIESILAEARRLKAGNGIDSVELASYNFNAHSRVVDIIKELQGLFWSVTFQSQRVDILARSPGLIRFEAAAGKRAFTVGVEGLSSRVRAYYCKELSEADLRDVLARLVREGARELKLFYILSGFETEADLSEFSAFVSWLRGAVDERPSAPRVVFSAGELVRMPFTPLAYEALMLEASAYRAIRSRFEAIVGSARFEARAPESFDEYCLSQVLALPPDGAFGLLLAMAERGYCYDRAVSRGAWQFARSYLAAEADGAKRAAESARAASDDADESDMADDPGSPSPPRPGSRPFDASYLARKPRDYPFPYAFVRPLASRDHLYGRFLDAARSEERVSCLGSDCAACGACDDGERTFLSGHRLDDAGSGDIEDVMSLMAAKRRPHETWLRGAVTFEAAAAPPAYAAALFRCGLYAAVPQLLETVWTVEDAFIKSASGLERLPGAWGDTWYRALSSAPLRAETLVAAGYVVSLAAPSVERVSIELVFIGASVPEAVRLVSDYLAAATIPCTLAKSGGEARYIVSDKGLKKRNVLAASLAPREDGTAVASLSCGAKHDLGPLAALAAKRRIRLDVRVRLDASPRP